MTYSAVDLAKYVVGYCNKKNQPITNLKLQKMLYFLWIKYFKESGQVLYTDDICAWQLGPVVPDVYYEFCSYAGIPIMTNPKTTINEKSDTTLNSAIDAYLPFTARKLVDLTHKKGKPWDLTYRNGEGNREVIPFELIIKLECDS